MQKFEIFDETFDQDRTETYELSIQIFLNGFSLYVRDVTRNLFIAFISQPFSSPTICADEWDKQIDGITTTYSWLKKPFKSVLFSFKGKSSVLTPTPLFDASKAKQLLTLTHPIKDLDEVRFSAFAEGLTTIFSAPTQLITKWLSIQEHTKVVAFSDPFLVAHTNGHSNYGEDFITLGIEEEFILVFISSKKKVVHFSSLDMGNPEDVTYFLLAIAKSLELNSAKTPIQIIGNRELSNKFEPLLSRFFQSTTKISPIPKSSFSYLISNYKERFVNLFIQSLCAL